MKISLSWLSDHIKISPNVDIQKISESLTNLGLEVENVYNPSLALKDFIIAKIIEVTKHPNADRLTLCKVDVGNNVCDVVCGANNVRENLKVVFAPIGSVIPSTGQVLKKKEIRGVVGEGMLCSEKELALGDNHEGILELSNDAPVGELYYEWAGISDYILDIAITPNRGDCASVLGIARELSSLELGKLINKNFPTIKGNYKSPINWKIDLDNSNKYLVPYVKGRYFRGLKNTTSPEWLQKKLFSVGLKPISALVDLTNFITLDIGRPLHVFDCKKIKGNLIMRMAKTGESLLCLDGNKYNLNNKNLIISDEKGPQSIAGVMGGMESGCTFDTTEMFLESAIFDKNIVAYNGRSMNILSDARYRFERGIDHKSADYGLEYMTKLVLDICGGEASDVVSDGSNAIKKNHINFRTAQVKKIGGIEISKNLQTKIFKKLGFNIKEKSNTIKVEVPSWRHDINEEVDLIEELMRVNGYEKIKNQPLDENNIFNHTTISLAEQRMRIARDVLARRGLIENISFSFLSKNDGNLFLGDSISIELDNPISDDLSMMRPSLIPNLINCISKNKRKGFFNNSIFEVSSVFYGIEEDKQISCAAAVREGHISNRHWSENARDVDIFDVKSDALEILEALAINTKKITLSKNAPEWYHPGRSASINLGKLNLGFFGELHPRLAQRYEMRPVFFEIFTDKIPGKSIEKVKPEFVPYNLMPLTRDFAFWIDNELSSQEIVNTIIKVGIKNELLDITNVSIFDIYEDNFHKDKKSIAVEVQLQPTKKTLTDKEIQEISDLIVSKLSKNYGAVLRK